MKAIIENVTGLTFAGHMCIRTEGATIVEAPDSRAAKLVKLVRRGKMGPGDRLVSAADFVQATGCTVIIGSKVYKPKKRKAAPKAEVVNLIR